MFSATAYIIRRANHEDASALRDLATLDSQAPIHGPALIGEIDGRPAAAISIEDGRLVADPFQHTADLTAILRMRAQSLRAYERTSSLRERIRAGIRVSRVRPAGA